MMSGTGDEDGDITFSISQEHLSNSQNEEDSDSLGLQPVSIKQVLESTPVAGAGSGPKSRFLLQNKEIHLVTLVAAVIRADPRNDGVKLELQDGGKGHINAYWDFKKLEEHEYANSLELDGGCYVRVIGWIVRPQREAGDDDPPVQNYLKLTWVRRVADTYEIFFHVLEVINCFRLRTKASRPVEEDKDGETTRISELVDSAGRVNLSEERPSARNQAPAPQPRPSSSSFTRNNALGLTDSPLFVEVPDSRLNAGASTSAQANHASAGENGAKTGRAIMRSLSSQSTLVDSPESQSPVRTETSSPSQDANSDPLSHLSNLERAIHVYLLHAKGNNGCDESHIMDITHGVKALHNTAADILAALDALEDLGFIRATDEFHYELIDEEESLYGTPENASIESLPGSFPSE